MYLLQTPAPDLTWLPLMGEAALGIVGLITITVIFIKQGLPKIIEYKKELELAKINIQKNACGGLQESHELKLQTIEKLLHDNIQNNNDKFSKVETYIKELTGIVTDHEELFGPVSQGTLENMLFNNATPIFRRLKAFLRLLAMGVNGRVKQKGMTLILQNQETWLDVLETMPKLKLKIIDEEHLNAVLEEINHKIYDGMMR